MTFRSVFRRGACRPTNARFCTSSTSERPAGTQIGRYAERVNVESTRARIVMHPHGVTLRAIPTAERYCFSIRHPVTRFRSSFLSRKRKGGLRDIEWSGYDAAAFARFETANEALFEHGGGRDAALAMNSITHCARDQGDTFRAEPGPASDVGAGSLGR